MMRATTLAILTNARAADQRSMIGYGELLLEAAQSTGYEVMEFRPASLLAALLPGRIGGRIRKIANNLDRFILTPIKFLGRRADIVHVVDPGNVVYLPLIRHQRSIVTVHDMIPYLARDGKLPGFSPTRAGRWLMNRITTILATVDQIVCVSHATERDLLSYVDIPETRVSVIQNAVFQPMYPESAETCAAFRAHRGLPQAAPILLHVGRGFYKNRELVLEIAAEVRRYKPDLRLVVVGELTTELRERAWRLGIHDCLDVLEHVSSDEMRTLYCTAAVLLFPSYYEGFGLPVVEAQLCGTWVVCSDKGSLPEISGPGVLMAETGSVNEYTQLVMLAISEQSPYPQRLSCSFAEWSEEYLQLYFPNSLQGRTC